MKRKLFKLKERIRLWFYTLSRRGKCEAVLRVHGVVVARCGAAGGWGGCFEHTWPIKFGIEKDGQFMTYENGELKPYPKHTSPYKDGVETENINDINESIT